MVHIFWDRGGREVEAEQQPTDGLLLNQTQLSRVLLSLRKELSWGKFTTTASRLLRWMSFKWSSSLWSLAKFTKTCRKERRRKGNESLSESKMKPGYSQSFGRVCLLGLEWSERLSSPLCWAPPCSGRAGRKCGRGTWGTRAAGTAACCGASPSSCCLGARALWSPSPAEGLGPARPPAGWWCSHHRIWGTRKEGWRMKRRRLDSFSNFSWYVISSAWNCVFICVSLLVC